MKNHIKACIDLTKKDTSKCEVVGISALTSVKRVTKAQVHNSRGEFVGYSYHKGELLLFRDRLGARNLYYAQNLFKSKVYVSTDLVWLLGKVKPEINPDYFKDIYDHFQISLDSLTPYYDIMRVRPATIIDMRVGPEKFIYSNYSKYWESKYNEKEFDAKHLRYLLEDAVNYRKKCIGERYTGYLSGGLDSSTIVSIVKPKETFSGYYREEGYSEMDYITRVVDNIPGMKSNAIQITQKEFHKQLSHLGAISPDPHGGLGIVPQVIVAERAAKKGYRYSFTGEGGDEVFTGYAWNTIIFSLNNGIPNLLRDRYLIRYEQSLDLIRKQGWLGVIAPFLSRSGDVVTAVNRLSSFWDESLPVENNVLNINLKVGLPAILTVDEAVGLYTGVMPVSPLIDHELVDYVCSIRPEERAKIPKYMLREATKGILPEKVRNRYDKMGFPVPYDTWKWPMLQKAARYLNCHIKKNAVMSRENWALYNKYAITQQLEDLK